MAHVLPGHAFTRNQRAWLFVIVLSRHAATAGGSAVSYTHLAAIAKSGTPVFAWKGETLREYWDCTWKAMNFLEADCTFIYPIV